MKVAVAKEVQVNKIHNSRAKMLRQMDHLNLVVLQKVMVHKEWQQLFKSILMSVRQSNIFKMI